MQFRTKSQLTLVSVKKTQQQPKTKKTARISETIPSNQESWAKLCLHQYVG